jgi:hypothetical protein
MGQNANAKHKLKQMQLNVMQFQTKNSRVAVTPRCSGNTGVTVSWIHKSNSYIEH